MCYFVSTIVLCYVMFFFRRAQRPQNTVETNQPTNQPTNQLQYFTPDQPHMEAPSRWSCVRACVRASERARQDNFPVGGPAGFPQPPTTTTTTTTTTTNYYYYY